MQSILLKIPKEIASQIKLPPKRAKKNLMEELVIRLYNQEIITSAQGAALLKKERIDFERFLAENETPIHGSPEDIDQDAINIEIPK